MFKINYRIVDDLQELKELNSIEFNKDYTDIVGFFSINYNENVEGYFHDNELRNGETGNEMLTLWFELFLKVVETLSVSEYAAFREIDSINTWHEFKRNGNKITVNIAKDNLNNADYFITEQQERFSYTLKNINISYDELVQEVLNKSEIYFKEVLKINSELGKANLFIRFESKLQSLR